MGRRLGQHFLARKSILDRIAAAACEDRCPLVIEIGPGKGALTESLLDRAGRVVAIELDSFFIHYLTQKFHEPIAQGRLTLIEGDVLKIDLRAWGEAVIAGNLPYYITSPILQKVFDLRAPGGGAEVPRAPLANDPSRDRQETVARLGDQAVNSGASTQAANSGASTQAVNSGASTQAVNSGASTQAANSGALTQAASSGASTWTRAVFLVQAEVAERIAAQPGSRDFGYLSVQTQVMSRPEILFPISRTAFRPPPKVDSAVVRLEPRDAAAEFGLADIAGFLRFASACFRQKRKTLRNNLAPMYGKDVVDALPEGKLRAEQLSVAELITLYRRLTLAQPIVDARRL